MCHVSTIWDRHIVFLPLKKLTQSFIFEEIKSIFINQMELREILKNRKICVNAKIEHLYQRLNGSRA